MPAGTYFLEIDGVGAGNPLVSPPTGYTDYGSLGRYTISGTVVDPAGGVPDTQAPSAPQNVVGTALSSQVDLAWVASTDNAAVIGYDTMSSPTRSATPSRATPAATSR